MQDFGSSRFASLLAPWSSFYANHSLVSTSILAAHVVLLLVGGGIALATDRATLRMLRDQDATLPLPVPLLAAEIAAAHRIVLAALLGIIFTGLLMLAADLETFAGSVVFWIKMTLLLLLIMNGAVVRKARAERMRSTAFISMTLWILITVAGVVLGNV